MKHIAYEIIKVKEPISEPVFTEDGVLMPESYFLSYDKFHNAVCDELERLNFTEFMNRARLEGIEPVSGFPDWVGEATLTIWVYCLRTGKQSIHYWPKSVASNIVSVSSDMFAELLLERTAASPSIIH